LISEFVLNMTDELSANALSSDRLRNDEFAEISTEPEVVGTDVAQNLAAFFPNKCQPIGRGEFALKSIIPRRLLPESGLSLHQDLDLGQVTSCCLSDHSFCQPIFDYMNPYWSQNDADLVA